MNYPVSIQASLHKLSELCRALLHQEDRPEGRALLETTADVLGGLEQAFHDFAHDRKGFTSFEGRKTDEPWD